MFIRKALLLYIAYFFAVRPQRFWISLAVSLPVLGLSPMSQEGDNQRKHDSE